MGAGPNEKTEAAMTSVFCFILSQGRKEMPDAVALMINHKH